MAENLAPHVVAALARQIRALAMTPPDGVTLVPSEALHEIYADIEGPADTPYEGGVFRVKLALGNEYPAGPPKGYFMTKIFHPNVSDKGDICVNTLKKDWKADTTLAHVLAVVRCLLIVPFPESSLNDEAGKMFMESYEEYCRKARLVTSVHALKAAAGASVVAAGAGAAAAPAAAGAGGDASSSSSASSSAAAGGPEGAAGGSDAGDVAAVSSSSSSASSTASVAAAGRGASGADAIKSGKVNVAGPAAAVGGAAEKRPREAVAGATSSSAAAAAAAMGVKKKSMKRL